MTSPTARPAEPGRRRLRGWLRGNGPWAILLAVPVVVLFFYFNWLPMLNGFVMSVQQTNLVADPVWVGLENFEFVLSDPLLPKAVMNTVWFLVLALVLGFPLPLVLAVFMAELRSSRSAFSALAYLPVIVPPVVAILLWKVFYDPSPTGVFNTVLSWVGIPAQPWLNSQAMAMPSIVLEATWASAGTAVIIYMAALTGVQSELYEAAEIDGAGIWRRVWHVTLPQLRGVVLVMLLLQIIGTAQVFTEPYVFTAGGPNNSTLTVLMLIYNYAFRFGDFGAAIALSVLLTLALGLVSILFQLATRRWSR